MGIESQFAPTPQHGAAWAVILTELVPPPQGITDRAGFDERMAKLFEIRAWTQAQPQEVREAYLWAADQTEKACREMLAVVENRERIINAMKDIPRPPR